jgi:hypothetical protein
MQQLYNCFTAPQSEDKTGDKSSEVVTIHLAAIAIVPGFSHLCGSHWDKAVVGRRMAVTWSPQQPKAWQRIWSGYYFWLRSWRVHDGEDNLLS